MRLRTPLLTAVLCVVAAGALAPAQAAPKPKSYEGSVAFQDTTPDPTGNSAATDQEHCRGELPREKGVTLKVANPGVVTVSISGFQGDWTLMVTDDKDKTLGGADVNPPDYENAVITLKKPATIVMYPCNLVGSFDATLSWAYRYKKP